MKSRDEIVIIMLQWLRLYTLGSRGSRELNDGYYVAYKAITLSCILFMFIEMKFIHCHSCVMFAMKSMSMCNDYVNYDEIII